MNRETIAFVIVVSEQVDGEQSAGGAASGLSLRSSTNTAHVFGVHLFFVSPEPGVNEIYFPHEYPIALAV